MNAERSENFDMNTETQSRRNDWIYEIAKKAAELAGGRAVMIWGDYGVSRKIKEILEDAYHINVHGFIDSDDLKTDNQTVYPTAYIDGKANEYFVVIPVAFYRSIKEHMLKCGYSETDYFYYNDCVISETEDYYEDNRGNRIIGFHKNLKIVFDGKNSCVSIQGVKVHNDTSHMYIGSDAVITIEKSVLKARMKVGDHAEVSFGERCVIDGDFELGDGASLHVGEDLNTEKFSCMLGDGAKCEIGNKCTFIKNSEVLVYDNAECRIGGGCAFSYGNRINVGTDAKCILGEGCSKGIGGVLAVCPGTTLTIGDDAMFSSNVCLLTNDGHSIFDVHTKKNINSSKEINKTRRIVLGKHVWLGEGVMVLYGADIGDSSIIGARSLVKSRIPNNCVAVGSPAKVVKEDVTWCREYGSEDVFDCGAEFIKCTEKAERVE